MKPETRTILDQLLTAINNSAASGLLGRDIIILATSAIQALSREDLAAGRSPPIADEEAAHA